MDNLAHTLAGAVLGEAGLKEKTGLGMATLMIAANIPDIDVIALLFDENLAFRRGITHGPVALILLPVVLTAIMIWFDKWQDRRGKRPAKRIPVHAGWLLALAYIGTLSHPVLDWLNVYGIRCLAPFSDRWFYGDTLFIIDVWLWTVLAVGVWLARRRRKRGHAAPRIPAITAIIALAAYVGAMNMASNVAEAETREAVIAAGYGTPDMVVASPPPINPFHRDMIYRVDARIGDGTATFAPAMTVTLGAPPFADNMDAPEIARARAASKDVADFLFWARLPYAKIDRTVTGTRVTVTDARYDETPGGTFTVEANLPTE
ncbi:metal-dependent hydrolase [Pacificimonas sp. WHA3]|uniref:Metal-dependent hydrolase n=1 Tax=Pacificimonas pallii TaxID=2827236 RepID=A0ABS6SCF4_9SPHN|nr:metal-dependent hydrolase [Pacificimonas pallii]MBV7256094.1 metal-dependent hydrolase [Pacificimonas pallii]